MQTLKNAKRNLKQNKRIPRISTRGFYDLKTGRTKISKPYVLYPKKFFDGICNVPEITIMIHGLRNNKSGALAKFRIARQRLWQLGYAHPVVGFSYDSNIKGAQYKSHERNATRIGVMIAKKNGKNLAKFIINVKKRSPNTRIRLVGHSLGSQVILSALAALRGKKLVEAAYVFGASIPSDSIGPKASGGIIQKTVNKKFVNYYSKHDQVLRYAFEQNLIPKPVGCYGASGKTVAKYVQKHIHPYNHRFASYARALLRYP